MLFAQETRAMSKAALLLAMMIAGPAASAGVPDIAYIHCPGNGGDFRVSELSHVISQFSVREQQYKPLCATCVISEWGDRIVMKDGVKTSILFNRITGEVAIQRSSAGKVIPTTSYRGICARGTVVTARTVRAF